MGGVINLEKIKAELCVEICGSEISKISIGSVGVRLFGKERKTLKRQCNNSNVKKHLLDQVRSRKPRGIYLIEYLSTSRLKI